MTTCVRAPLRLLLYVGALIRPSAAAAFIQTQFYTDDTCTSPMRSTSGKRCG